MWYAWYIWFKMSLFSVCGVSLDWKCYGSVDMVEFDQRLDLIISEIFSNLNDFTILWSQYLTLFSMECYGTWFLVMNSTSRAIIFQLLFHPVLLISLSARFTVFPAVCSCGINLVTFLLPFCESSKLHLVLKTFPEYF